MTVTHHAPTNRPHGQAGATQRPEPHDPERDIDAKSTATWVIVSSILLFIALYFLLPLFDFVMTSERTRKINELPPQELNELVGSERAFLRGETSPAKKSIEQVMQEMVKK